jgi:hypothetical protein
VKGLTDLVDGLCFRHNGYLFRLKEIALLAFKINEEVAETESALFS